VNQHVSAPKLGWSEGSARAYSLSVASKYSAQKSGTSSGISSGSPAQPRAISFWISSQLFSALQGGRVAGETSMHCST
jgi:hypothetical protein